MDNPEIQDLQKNLKIAQEELTRLQRIKPLASAAAAIVHDIRNSLGVIQSTTQFVLSKLKPSAQEKEAWQLVGRNVESIRKLLHGYLSLARQTEVPKEKASINDLVERVLHFIDVQCSNNNIRVIKNLSPQIPKIMLEIPAVESAILNLSINAVEAMSEGGTLKFESNFIAELRQIVLMIEDTGTGIPAQVTEKLFTPFLTTKDKGSGMGLYSTRSIMTQHAAKISCESAPGKTVMTLTFPYA